MKIISKALKQLGEEKYYLKHLQIINQLLPVTMTNKETEVLAAFLSLGGDIVKKDRFGTTARKIVMDKLSLSPGGLGNYMKQLNNKGFIFKNEYNVFEVRDFLFPEEDNQGYQIKISK